MERLIPKGAYFKQTTRKLLSPAEKERLAEVAGRSIQRLIKDCEDIPLGKPVELWEFPAALRNVRRRARLFDRVIHLVKGETQPRQFYGRARRTEIYFEASRIAQETGADPELVYETFIASMDEFVVRYP